MRTPPTPDEIVSTLKHSALPTLVVEGVEDMDVMRLLEQELSETQVSLLPCGGRTSLLAVYARRHEYSQVPVAFLADLDLWVFSSPPPQYSEIIFTTGYSIENDLYHDAGLERLLSQQQKPAYKASLTSIANWFSFEVGRAIDNIPGVCLSHHPNKILGPNGATSICSSFAQSIGFSSPNPQLYTAILSDYQRLLRGKTLFSLLLRHLSAQNSSARYSRAILAEISIRMSSQRPRLDLILSRIRTTLSHLSNGQPQRQPTSA